MFSPENRAAAVGERLVVFYHGDFYDVALPSVVEIYISRKTTSRNVRRTHVDSCRDSDSLQSDELLGTCNRGEGEGRDLVTAHVLQLDLRSFSSR